MTKAKLSLAAVLLLTITVDEMRADWRLWTTSQTRHVLRDDPAENSLAVKLAAARNEWRSFQILLRSDKPVKEINVVPADLVGPDGAVLRATDARAVPPTPIRTHNRHLSQRSVQAWLVSRRTHSFSASDHTEAAQRGSLHGRAV